MTATYTANPYHCRIGTGRGPADCTTDNGDVVGAFYTPSAWSDPAAGTVTVYINGHEARLTNLEAKSFGAMLTRMAGEI